MSTNYQIEENEVQNAIQNFKMEEFLINNQNNKKTKEVHPVFNPLTTANAPDLTLNKNNCHNNYSALATLCFMKNNFEKIIYEQFEKSIDDMVKYYSYETKFEIESKNTDLIKQNRICSHVFDNIVRIYRNEGFNVQINYNKRDEIEVRIKIPSKEVTDVCNAIDKITNDYIESKNK